MAEIRKKDSSTGFQASEAKFENLSPKAEITSGVGQERKASAFDSGVGSSGSSARPTQAEPAPAQPIEAPAPQARPAAVEPTRSQPAAPAEEPKKRYYNPQEVMKKKGCIGCGGMVLAAPVIVSVIALAVRLL